MIDQILWNADKSMGPSIKYLLPEREDEGYFKAHEGILGGGEVSKANVHVLFYFKKQVYFI